MISEGRHDRGLATNGRLLHAREESPEDRHRRAALRKEAGEAPHSRRP